MRMIWIHVTCLLFMFSMVLSNFDNKKADFALRRTKTKTIQFSRESFSLKWAQQSAEREYRVWPMMRPRKRRENSSIKQVATKGGDNKRKTRRKMRRGKKREPLTRQEKRLRRRGEEKRIYSENGATRRPRQRHRGHQHRRNLEKQYLVRNRTLELLDKREMQRSERLSSSVYPSVDALYERRRIMSKKVSQILGESGVATSRRIISDFLVQKPFKKHSGKNVFRSGNANRPQITETAATRSTVATSREKQVTDADARRVNEMAEERTNKMEDGESNKMAEGQVNKMAAGQVSKMAEGLMSKMAEGRMSKMAAGQVSKMAAGQVSKMAAGQMSKIAEGQVSKMAAGQMRKMAEGQVSKMAAGEMSKMAAGQVNKMAAEEISKMAAEHVNKMAAGEMSKMAAGQVKKMAAEEISKMAAEQVNKMAAGEMSKMAAGQVKKMAAGEMSKMAAGQLNKMAAGEMSKMAAGQVKKMAAEEISKMAAEQVNKMAAGEMSKMAAGQVKKMAAGEMSKMAAGQLNKMAAGEMSKMAAGQLNKMTAGQMNKMAEGQVSKMAAGQVSKMEDGQTSGLDREQMNETDEKKMIAVEETRDNKMTGKQLNETGERRFAEMDEGVMRKMEEEVGNEMDGEGVDPPDEKRSNKIGMVETREKINLQEHSVHVNDEDSPFLEKLQVTATKLSERNAAGNNLDSEESGKELSENFYANGYHYDYENVFSEPSIPPWSNPSANKQSPRSADDEYVLDKALLSSVYMPIDDQIALHESLTALSSRLFESLRNTTSNANEQLIRDFDFDNSLHGDLCQKWLDCKDKLEEAFLGPLALPACPCRYPSSIFYDDKIWDEAGQKHFRWRDVSGEGERLDVYKPGAAYCVRSLLAQGGGSVAAQHCCYDSRRRLLTRGSGAGTPNFVSPEVSTILHEKIDVLPWRLCKGDFSRFNDVRPPNNDNHCKDNPAEEEYQRQIETTKHY